MTLLSFTAFPLNRVDQNSLVFTSSDEGIAQIVQSDGKSYIKVVGNGEVTVEVAWIGNELFDCGIKDRFTFNAVSDAVAVYTSPQLVQAMQTQTAAVLMADIMLGTDENGKVLDETTRKNTLIANRIKSTYNIEWYKRTGTEGNAKVTHALEFTNNVYGNGKYINADNYTHVMDGTGAPRFEGVYSGPLKFVKYQQVASVAGQDNCAFLIRKDGIKLYGVQLLGCSDSSIFNDETNNYDLNMLNLVGTTLEINANCDILNCRIQNGRNVVRVYGGNRDGSKYFVDKLSDSVNVQDERITVNIEGCIITQGREFLVKLGANRALRASNALGAEPRLTNPTTGVAYSTADGSTTSNDYFNLLNDQAFYDNYVMTDLTIADSVLETSGLFCIGVESNFAGDYLYEGSTGKYRFATDTWERSGGTSFPAVLRLKGDVRMYDWKDLSLVNSDTLIQSEGTFKEWLKLNINDMFDFVSKNYGDRYGNLVHNQNGAIYVHGGIAFYGGGVNYSQIDLSGLNSANSDLSHVRINISILANAPSGTSMYTQGTMLPNAAGRNDFNFFLYGNDSPNSYAKQVADKNSHSAYTGVASLPLY